MLSEINQVILISRVNISTPGNRAGVGPRQDVWLYIGLLLFEMQIPETTAFLQWVDTIDLQL